jgi:hypothetical protein
LRKKLPPLSTLLTVRSGLASASGASSKKSSVIRARRVTLSSGRISVGTLLISARQGRQPSSRGPSASAKA